MSTVPTPVTVAPAPKLNAIQLIEQEIVSYLQQRETAIANLHALDGAVQSARSIIAKLHAEVAKVEAAVKAEVIHVVDEARAKL